MRRNTKIIIVTTLVLLICNSFSLVKTHDRNKSYQLPILLRQQVIRESNGMSEMQIINYSLDLTAKMLQFDNKNDIAHGKANCIGYAQLCSAICNQALASNGYKCRAKPVVGYIKDCGVNLCDVAKQIMPNKRWRNFVKDHDFVELSFKGKTYYFDPSIYDVLGNKCLTVK